uniref:Uncharacterized protein n=1 Tax=viral metagenome TaxID=1070528 RepID=A0A6M3L4K2_9ZZZZ
MHFATLAWESGIDELIELVRLKGESLGISLPRPLTAKKEEKEIKTILEKAKVDNKKFGGNLNRDGQPRRRLKRL